MELWWNFLFLIIKELWIYLELSWNFGGTLVELWRNFGGSLSGLSGKSNAEFLTVQRCHHKSVRCHYKIKTDSYEVSLYFFGFVKKSLTLLLENFVCVMEN